jgi:pyridoxal/pyridoxine/pyridoxamine kinase
VVETQLTTFVAIDSPNFFPCSLVCNAKCVTASPPEEIAMNFLRRAILRHRARQSILSSLRFAQKLRDQNSEFAPTYVAILNGTGDELAALVKVACRNDEDRRAVLAGAIAGLQRVYPDNPALSRRLARQLAPRVLSPRNLRETGSAWMKLAV